LPGQSISKKPAWQQHEQAEALTGLQAGGISALALVNKGFDIYLTIALATLKRSQ
jgi:prolyl-tRNA editing enzyme YbaK/EbsC (Cys-tRNA(Pro) deacylase)